MKRKEIYQNMNIIVCMKQIPDTSEIKIDPETNTPVSYTHLEIPTPRVESP